MIEAPSPAPAADEFADDSADQRQHNRDPEPREIPEAHRAALSRSSVCRRSRAQHAEQLAPSGIDLRRAVSVFSISGKKQISAVITMVGRQAKPNQMMKSGPSASFGTTWLATM